jgi:REP-associated tyrosine transposase
MPNYRRVYAEGGCWFFTVNLEDREEPAPGALREAVAKVSRRLPFAIDAWVVLPDHMHAVWTLPPGDADFPTRWRLIWAFFSRSLPATERRTAVHRARCERGIWQRRYGSI